MPGPVNMLKTQGQKPQAIKENLLMLFFLNSHAVKLPFKYYIYRHKYLAVPSLGHRSSLQPWVC